MEMIVTILTYWFLASLAAAPFAIAFLSGARKLSEECDDQGGDV